MIKEIKVFCRLAMDMYVESRGFKFPYNSWYLISIYSEDYPFVTKKTDKIISSFGCKGHTSLDFWDVTDKDYEGLKRDYPKNNHVKKIKLFNKTHAKKIINLIDLAQKDEEDVALVLHCAAGISRSGAAATFACDYCKLDYSDFVKNNPLLHPNSFVLRVLHEVSGMTPIGTHSGIGTLYDLGGSKIF